LRDAKDTWEIAINRWIRLKGEVKDCLDVLGLPSDELLSPNYKPEATNQRTRAENSPPTKRTPQTVAGGVERSPGSGSPFATPVKIRNPRGFVQEFTSPPRGQAIRIRKEPAICSGSVVAKNSPESGGGLATGYSGLQGSPRSRSTTTSGGQKVEATRVPEANRASGPESSSIVRKLFGTVGETETSPVNRSTSATAAARFERTPERETRFLCMPLTSNNSEFSLLQVMSLNMNYAFEVILKLDDSLLLELFNTYLGTENAFEFFLQIRNRHV